MNALGNKIRNLRKNKNVTQEELAEALAVSAQAISKWENGQSSPAVEFHHIYNPLNCHCRAQI